MPWSMNATMTTRLCPVAPMFPNDKCMFWHHAHLNSMMHSMFGAPKRPQVCLVHLISGLPISLCMRKCSKTSSFSLTPTKSAHSKICIRRLTGFSAMSTATRSSHSLNISSPPLPFPTSSSQHPSHYKRVLPPSQMLWTLHFICRHCQVLGYASREHLRLVPHAFRRVTKVRPPFLSPYQVLIWCNRECENVSGLLFSEGWWWWWEHSSGRHVAMVCVISTGSPYLLTLVQQILDFLLCPLLCYHCLHWIELFFPSMRWTCLVKNDWPPCPFPCTQTRHMKRSHAHDGFEAFG